MFRHCYNKKANRISIMRVRGRRYVDQKVNQKVSSMSSYYQVAFSMTSMYG
jgi:hypothetical protein